MFGDVFFEGNNVVVFYEIRLNMGFGKPIFNPG